MSRANPLTIDTLYDLNHGGYRLWLHCYRQGCHFSKQIDLQKLTAKLGEDHACNHWALVPHLYCLKCKSNDVGIRIHPPTEEERTARETHKEAPTAHGDRDA